jgi:cathepsin B
VNIEKHQKIVNFVNKLRTTWKAKVYDRDYSKLIGTWRNSKALPKRKTVFKTSKNDLPESYDLRDAYPNCETIKEIRDQSYCGACWAFSAAETMSDRLCIASGGELQTRVSAADIVTCCYYCGDGCFGGWPGSAFDYWIETGVPSGGLYGDTNSCVPYFFPPCDDHPHKCTDYHDTPECQTQCQDGYPKTIDEDRTYGSDDYSVSGEDDIMQEIYENGSVAAAFDVYEDFEDYSSGIYQHVTGDYLGGHAVKIIGWGVDDQNVKYWLIANSWNERWGENGYFRILKGDDECGIETEAVTGMPKL